MSLRVRAKTCGDLAAVDAGVTLRKLARGERGAVFVVNDAYVIKMGCAVRRSVTRYMGLESQEIAATNLMWFALAHTGVSPHVVQPFGCVDVHFITSSSSSSSSSLPLIAEPTAPPPPPPPPPKTTLAMEWLRGVPDAPGARNLRGLLRAHLRGTLPCDDAAFGSHFRAALFQTLYTLAAASSVFRGRLRLNDCHDRNVGVTEWRTTAGYEVLFPVVDAAAAAAGAGAGNNGKNNSVSYVARHFVVPCAVRAVLLDFGYATLRDEQTCGHDARFTVQALDTGMCGNTPSPVYDSCVLLYSLLQLCTKSRYAAHARAQELRAFFKRVCNNFHMCRAYKSAMAGRLALSTQRAMVAEPGMRAAMGVLTPLEMLRDEYFAPFRAADLCGAADVFGLRFARPVINLAVVGACSAKTAERIRAAMDAYTSPALALQPPARAGTNAGDVLTSWLGQHSRWAWCRTCGDTACSVRVAEIDDDEDNDINIDDGDERKRRQKKPRRSVNSDVAL